MVQSVHNNVPFSQIGRDLKACSEWIESLGVPIRAGRLQQYQQAIAELATAYEIRDPEHLQRQDVDYSNSLYEAHELIAIYKGLHSAKIPGVEKVVRKLLGGPEWRRLEKASNNGSIRARNAGVELISAALLANGGYSVAFPEGVEDFIASSPMGRLSVECKRLSSPEKLFDRIEKALKQCTGRVAASGLSDHCALAVIDLSWVSNPEFRFAPFPSADVAGKELSTSLARACAAIKQRVSMEDHQSVLGILARFSALIEDQSARMLVYTDHCHFIANQALENRMLPAGEDFVQRLQAARTGLQ